MKKYIVFAFAALLAVSCAPRQPRLVILHTNDTHSHLEPERGGELAGHGGAIERAAFVDSVRNAMGEENVLLLHAGDWNQGSSYFSELGGSVEVKVVNAMRYDAVTLGNHEFDNGIEDLTERLASVEVPVICANIDLSNFELGQYVKPWVIVEKAGMKIGIIGLETDLTTCVSRVIVNRLPVLDPVEVTNRYAADLRALGCDLVLVLSHQGYPEDQENIARCKGVDLVVGGHSHTFVDDLVYVEDLDGKKVPVITDGCWGLEMGQVNIY